LSNNLVKQFNQRAWGVLQNTPLPAGTSLSVAVVIDSEQRKTLTGVHASTVVATGAAWSPTANATQNRLIVCTGNLTIDLDGNVVPDPLPNDYSNLSVPRGAERVILYTIYQGHYDVDFNSPITCEVGEVLNVVVGRAQLTGEQIGVTQALVYLTALGWQGEDKDSRFPYRLR